LLVAGRYALDFCRGIFLRWGWAWWREEWWLLVRYVSGFGRGVLGDWFSFAWDGVGSARMRGGGC